MIDLGGLPKIFKTSACGIPRAIGPIRFPGTISLSNIGAAAGEYELRVAHPEKRKVNSTRTAAVISRDVRECLFVSIYASVFNVCSASLCYLLIS